MATSEAQICNKALARIGIRGAFIDDMRTDVSEEAEVCSVFYDDLRDAVLAAFPWPFATLRQELARIAESEEPVRDGWLYVYRLPNKCLAPRKIWPLGLGERALRSDQRVPYAIEKASVDDSQVVLCDLTNPVLYYTAQITDPTKLSAQFVDAFAWRLAADICMPLTAKPEIRDLARKEYMLKLNEAQAAALNQQQEDQPPLPEAIAARL